MAFATNIRLLTPMIRSMMVKGPRACLLRSANTAMFSSASTMQKLFSPQSSLQHDQLGSDPVSASQPEEQATDKPKVSFTINLVALDRAFNTFGDRCQRNERVSEKDFIKTFNTFTKAVEKLEESGLKENSHIRSNIIIYSSLLLRCCGNLMLDTPPKNRELLAGNLWTFIKEKQIPVEVSHYNSLIRVLNENGTSYDPKTIIDEMIERNLTPDKITHQLLMQQYCLQSDTVSGSELFGVVKDKGMELKEATLASTILDSSKQETPPTKSDVCQNFDLMQSNNMKPNSRSYLATAAIATQVGDMVPIVSPILKGAVLPFADWNFLQMVIFPYTFVVMHFMDLMLNFMPWWQAIIATTATARLLFFPLVVRQNIIGIKTFNLLPETQKIQVKLNEALAAGDSYNQALLRTKLKLLYNEHGLSMKDRLLPILVQAPMYMSIFFLLRGLTSFPAEGLTTGGALWFTNLTVPDPLFILPVITCTSMFFLLEFGMEGSVDPKQGMAPIGRYFMRSLPFLMFLFIHNFPAATLLFWSTSNIFTLSYAMLLKNSWVKQKLNIPARLKHDPASLPLSNISFKDQFRETMEKGKVKRTSMDIRRLDDIAFKKAGVGPLRKTYKEDPVSKR